MRTFATRSSPSQRGASPGPADPARLRAAGIQPRLRINAPGDIYEQEADQVADRVLRLPEPGVQRSCSCGGDCPDCRKKQEEGLVLQRCAEGAGPVGEAAPASVQTALRSPGEALDPSTERFFSSRFGHDFRNVRVHTDAVAARSAQEIQASAYTVGRDIVFAPGLYAPGSHEGRRLLAHELTHVVQQSERSRFRDAMLQRKSPAQADKVAALDVTRSRNGPACACLVVVHNDEQKARKTAELMHEHCAYNLALVNPDDGERRIVLPDGKDVDPNELFDKDVAKECVTNEAECTTAMESKAGSKKRKDVNAYLQRRYFLAIKDCSESFTLPVVALHNNRVKDTQAYRKELKNGTVNASDLKVDLAKDPVEDKAAEALRTRLREELGEKIELQLAGDESKTNIFGWCLSDELSRCHAGDPGHPDHLVWTTNEKDFETLSRTDVNVVLQSEAPDDLDSPSANDLSTLFLFLREILASRHDERISGIGQEVLADLRGIAEMSKDNPGSVGLLSGVGKTLIDLLVLLTARGEKARRLAGLRYLNIETPELSELVNPISDYDFVRGVLEEVGLPCRGVDAAAEDRIREDLGQPLRDALKRWGEEWLSEVRKAEEKRKKRKNKKSRRRSRERREERRLLTGASPGGTVRG